MDGMLSHLEELLEAKNIFVRNRKKMRTRVLGILMYHYGFSLRKCRTILSSFEDISHESIRKWYHKTGTIFTVKTAYRETVAVDETKLKINGEKLEKIDNDGKNWMVRLNKEQDVAYAISYDVPDETEDRYMDIEIVMYDYDIISKDDVIDIGNGSEKTLISKFDKVKNTISENGLTRGDQGRLWYDVTLSKEAENSKEVYDRTYRWRFNEKYWDFSLRIPVDIYKSYADSTVNRMPQNVSANAMKSFVTSDGHMIQEVAYRLESLAESENYTQVDTVNFILKFVQENVIYASDNLTEGQVEYWRYPVETLIDKKGDCEDSSVLSASIMDALDYDTALLFYVLEDSIGHLAVGIHINGNHGQYVENKDGEDYFYCETTNSAYSLGQIPPDIERVPDMIISV